MKRYLVIFLLITCCLDIIGTFVSNKIGNTANLVYSQNKHDTQNVTVSIPTVTPTKEFNNYTICIDPDCAVTSKSGNEPLYPNSKATGAAYRNGASGSVITEEAANLKYAIALKDKLVAEGFNVIMTRTQSQFDLSESERAAIGNNCDFVIRISSDGGDKSVSNGISVFYPAVSYSKQTDITSESKQLANMVFNSVITTTGAARRLSASKTDCIMFNWCKVPVFSIELGRISDSMDEKRINSSDYQEQFVSGIIQGISRYVITRQG